MPLAAAVLDPPARRRAYSELGSVLRRLHTLEPVTAPAGIEHIK